jgi:hypothetical protein
LGYSLILPYLRESERLFYIFVEELLTVLWIKREPWEVYRKVEAIELAVLV